jgi:hypothetical protein
MSLIPISAMQTISKVPDLLEKTKTAVERDPRLLSYAKTAGWVLVLGTGLGIGIKIATVLSRFHIHARGAMHVSSDDQVRVAFDVHVGFPDKTDTLTAATRQISQLPALEWQPDQSKV